MCIHKTIWLVGMMGAGKSTIGALLAKGLSVPFEDTDAWIGRRAGCTIPEIFEREGESGFREHEFRAIADVAGKSTVVALGGGALTQPAARELIEDSGVIVYLRARPGTLSRRVGQGAMRPLLAGLDRSERLERLRALLAQREPYYAKASVIIDTDGKRRAAVVSEIIEALGRLGLLKKSCVHGA